MPIDDGIRDLYRISGIRDIGNSYVFPKRRAVKKSEKTEEEEEEAPKKREGKKQSPPKEKEEGKRIDIEA